MKNQTMTVVVLLLASAAIAQDVAPAKSGEVDPNVQNTIAYINQMNYAYVVMKTYHNPLAVQEQYERIALDKIDITSIPDYEYNGKSVKDLILEMQTKLHDLAVADKDYAYYKECQEESRKFRKKMLWFDLAMSAPMALKNAGDVIVKNSGKADGYTVSFEAICTLAGDLIGGPVKKVNDYQNEVENMRIANREHEFRYEASKEAAVHEANQALLKAEFDFAKNLGLKRSDIVSPDELQHLMDVLKIGEQDKVYKLLNTPDMKRHFDVFAPYWYYLALSAVSTKHFEDAVDSAEMFFKRHRGLMKVDPMVAQAAVVEATALVGLECKDRSRLEAVLKKICDINYSNANSDQSYFCAEVLHRYLHDSENAQRVIEASIARLEGTFEQKLITYRNLYKEAKEDEKEKWREIPNDIDLLRARNLYSEILQGRTEGDLRSKMMSIVASDTTSALEKLFYVGKVRVDDLWAEAKKDILAIGLWHYRRSVRADSFYVEMPVSWFILGEVKPKITLKRGNDAVKVLDEVFAERKIKANKAGVGADVVSIAFSSKESLVGIDSVMLDFPHKSWPIQVVYKPSVDFNISEGRGRNDMTAYTPVEITFMGQRKDLMTPAAGVEQSIKSGKLPKYSDFLTPFKFGEVKYADKFLRTLNVDQNRTFHVAYTNPSPFQTSIELDVKYFTKFGAQMCHVESDEKIYARSGGEWELKWPEEVRGTELPALIYFQYHVDSGAWDWCKNLSYRAGRKFSSKGDNKEAAQGSVSNVTVKAGAAKETTAGQKD